MSPPKRFFFLKMEGDSGFQTPREDSLELCPGYPIDVNR